MPYSRRRFRLFFEQLWQLAGREIKRRYKDTILGWLWIILTPIIQAFIISFVFVRIVGLQSHGGAPYILIVLSGLTLWNFVASTISQSMSTFSTNSEMVNYQPVPLVLLPLANALIKTFDFFVEITVYLGLTLIIMHRLPANLLLGLPPLLLSLAMFVAGCSLLSSIIGILVRDFGHLISFILSVWFWLTPIFYPAAIIPSTLGILNLNPLIHFLAAFREMSLQGTLDPTKIAKLFVISTGFLLVSVVVFRSQKHKVYDRP